MRQQVSFSFHYILKRLIKMENRSLALKLVSEAVHLDSNGFSQAAFVKYLQSLQVLAMYLNELFVSLGFQKMMEKVREIKHVSCMIHECSDRVTAIADRAGQPVVSKLMPKDDADSMLNKPVVTISPTRLPGLEKLQNENMALLKSYQWRFERANDNYIRTNLKLELERRLAENDILAKKKFDIAVKQLQKERANIMEKEMKKLFISQQQLNEKEREKRDLYASVLEYTKTETWPCTWKLNSWEDSDIEIARKVFQRTIRCSDHPLSQWIVMVQTNIKQNVDTTLKHYIHFQNILPDLTNSEENPYSIKEVSDEYVFYTNSELEKGSISKHNISMLQKLLSSIASEILYTISSAVHIFYLTYKSLLPVDSEEFCLGLIESYVLKPIWSNLIILYRVVNIVPEYKILEAMYTYRNSKPTEFGYLNQNFDSRVSEKCILLLKTLPNTTSLTEKLKILVEVSQAICVTPSNNEGNQKRMGADEFMPLLCYIIVKSKLPQLSSECFAIEQLFDVEFMFGEEGYALSSFITALKYVEMKKLIDGENVSKTTSK